MGTNALALTRRGRGAAPSSQYSHDQAFCRRPRNARPFLTFSIPSTASISPVVFSKNGLHQAATGDTAELAFGAERVEVTESLLTDDSAGPRLRWALSEHRHLFSEPVPAGTNRVLIGLAIAPQPSWFWAQAWADRPSRKEPPWFWNLARP